MKPWEANIRRTEPYVPGEQPREETVIKLNTNENPYPPSPGVKELAARLETDRLRLYPDPTNSELVNALAECYGLNPERIFTGVGSDDVLAMSFLTFFNSGKPILFPDITYSFYEVWAKLYRIPYQCRPLDEMFRLRAEDYRRENGGIIFPNPNAPTGICEPLELIEEILREHQDVVVIIDEAYVDFAEGGSARALLDRYENLLVVQTFSKSRSMAGMRIGYAMGSEALIRALNEVKYSFNSYTLSQAALALGAASVRDKAYLEECVRRIRAVREWSKEQLARLGFSFPDSQANFLFVKHRTMPGKEIFEALRARGIYVRRFDGPRIADYLRITVGTQEQMEALLGALREIVGNSGPSPCGSGEEAENGCDRV